MRTQNNTPPAHKHGLRTGTLHLLPGEDPTEFQKLLEHHRQHLQPLGELEEASVYRLAVIDWQLQRLSSKEHGLSSAKLEEALRKTSEWAAFDGLDALSMVVRHLFAKACELTGTTLRWEEISSLHGIIKQLVVLLCEQLEQDRSLHDAIAPLGLLTYQLPTRGEEDLDSDVTEVGDFGNAMRSALTRVTPVVAAALERAEKALATKRNELSLRLLMPDGRTTRLLGRYRTSLEKQRERELKYLHGLVEVRMLVSIGSGNTTH